MRSVALNEPRGTWWNSREVLLLLVRSCGRVLIVEGVGQWIGVVFSRHPVPRAPRVCHLMGGFISPQQFFFPSEMQAFSWGGGRWKSCMSCPTPRAEVVTFKPRGWKWNALHKPLLWSLLSSWPPIPNINWLMDDPSWLDLFQLRIWQKILAPPPEEKTSHRVNWWPLTRVIALCCLMKLGAFAFICCALWCNAPWKLRRCFSSCASVYVHKESRVFC